MTNRFDGADKWGALIFIVMVGGAVIGLMGHEYYETGRLWPKPSHEPVARAEVEVAPRSSAAPDNSTVSRQECYTIHPDGRVEPRRCQEMMVPKMRCYDQYDTANPDNNKEVDCDLMRKIPLPTPTPAPTPHQFENPTNGFPRTYSIREI